MSRRVHEIGLTRRPGWFGPRGGSDPTALRNKAAELYEQGFNLRQVAEQLGVSSSTITKVLHEAQVPMRRPGYRSREQPPRTLVDDRYADPAIADCLRRFAVRRPGTDTWNPATPWESYAPLPLDPNLVRELYAEIGLSAQHVAMLCGLGVTAVRNRIAGAGITLRPRSQTCPWNQRRSGL